MVRPVANADLQDDDVRAGRNRAVQMRENSCGCVAVYAWFVTVTWRRLALNAAPIEPGMPDFPGHPSLGFRRLQGRQYGLLQARSG